ncbi:MAG TPA: lytic transglycosylase domain-containing protein [Pedococcus sp.]
MILRIGGALPAVALVGAGVALASSGSPAPAPQPAAAAHPQVTVPADALRRDEAPVLPALPPVPSEELPTPPAAHPAGGSAQDPASGIPARAHEAYRHAAALVGAADPACGVDWALVGAIGKVESDHGRYAGNGIDDRGTVRPGIYGLPLNGRNGTATIADSDRGELDRDTAWDRAVGPMQFIPTTWSVVGVDGNGDGAKDPQNITDAATATAVYLCSGPGDLTRTDDLHAAVLRYNQSEDYVREVVAIADSYRRGVTVTPSAALTPGQRDASPYLPTGDERPAEAAPAPASPSGSTGASRGGSGSGAGSGSGTGGDTQEPGGGTPAPETTPAPEPTEPDVLGDVTDTVTDAVESITPPPATPTPTPTTPTPSPTTPAPQPTCLVLGVVRVGDICL